MFNNYLLQSFFITEFNNIIFCLIGLLFFLIKKVNFHISKNTYIYLLISRFKSKEKLILYLYVFSEILNLYYLYSKNLGSIISNYYINYFFYESNIELKIKFYLTLINIIIILIYIESSKIKNYKISKEQIFSIISLKIICFYLLLSNHLLVSLLLLELLTSLTYIIFFTNTTKNSLSRYHTFVLYFIINSISTVFFLIGLIFYYIKNNTLFLVHNLSCVSISYNLSFLFLVGSLIIKLGVPPFHYWMVELYGNVKILELIILVCLIKYTFFLFLYKTIILKLFLNFIYLNDYFFLFVITSIFFGLMGLYKEKVLKKFFCYSSILHFSYMLAFLTGYSYDFFNSSIYYFNLYIIMTLIFLLFIYFSTFSLKKFVYIADLKKLNNISIKLVLIFYINILIMVGVPPFIGFYSKLKILNFLINENNLIIFFIILACILISIFCYLRLFYNNFFFSFNYTNKKNKVFFISNNIYYFLFYFEIFYFIYIL